MVPSGNNRHHGPVQVHASPRTGDVPPHLVLLVRSRRERGRRVICTEGGRRVGGAERVIRCSVNQSCAVVFGEGLLRGDFGGIIRTVSVFSSLNPGARLDPP